MKLYIKSMLFIASLAASQCGAMHNPVDAGQREDRAIRWWNIHEREAAFVPLGFTTLALIGQGFARKILTDGPAREILGEVLPVATISAVIAMYVMAFKIPQIMDNDLSTKKRFNAVCSSMIQLSAAAAVIYGGVSRAIGK